MPPTAPPHEQPRLQIGRYQVVHPLGQGAMGEVLLAYDPVLDRNVAIKYLRRDLELLPAQRDSLVQRLWQEARASARLAHPNIVALHDMGEDTALGPYLVFEYVEGPTLKERLRRGALEPKAAARLARELGEALATAHAAGVLHRDVKPENVILRRSGAKVADFGIARLPNSTLTRRGSLLGTPAYSAPETLEGAQFSPHSDQFSLASTLYEAISGQRAFPGDDALQVASRVRLDEPRPVATGLGLSPKVDQILAQALSKKPNQRFSDCAAFGAALADALNDSALSDSADNGLLPVPRGQDTLASVLLPVTRAKASWAPTALGVALAAAAAYIIMAPQGDVGSAQRAVAAAPIAATPRVSKTPLGATATLDTARNSWVAPKAPPLASKPLASKPNASKEKATRTATTLSAPLIPTGKPAASSQNARTPSTQQPGKAKSTKAAFVAPR